MQSMSSKVAVVNRFSIVNYASTNGENAKDEANKKVADNQSASDFNL